MRLLKAIGRFIRISLLVAALAATLVLFYWNRRNDPRFYWFLHTKPGQVLERVFRWGGPAAGAMVREKAEADMTPEELAAKKSMERAAITKAGTNRPPAVTYRDVRFRLEFPQMEFCKCPPFTIMTSESPTQVERTVNVLQDLHRQFLETFGALANKGQDEKNIQVLLFSRESEFDAYQRKYAPKMEISSGFYSPWIDRLVVFNQSGSDYVKWRQRTLRRWVAKYLVEAKSDDERERIVEWQEQAQQRIAEFADQQTTLSIRHEGAHQLFYTYGIHSTTHVENEWLIEGLSTYCETPVFGEDDPWRMANLKKALRRNALLPLHSLMNLRRPEGLMYYGLPERVDLAYAQAWSLVSFLMQPAYRPAFFDYIRFLRDPANFDEARTTPALELVARFLGLAPGEFQRRWLEYVEQLETPVPAHRGKVTHMPWEKPPP